jgi:hypothetical protein
MTRFALLAALTHPQSLRPNKLMGLSLFAAIIISYTQQLTITSKAAQKKS